MTTGSSTTVYRMAARCALLALLAIPAMASAQGGGAVVKQRTLYEDIQMFSGVLNHLRQNHPDSLDTHKLILEAIHGMLRAADPHSFVIPAIRLEPERQRAMRDGKLFPVPIDWIFVGGAPVIASVIAGTKTAQADLLPGDELLAVDGKPVLAGSSMELDITLAGARNSTVTLEIERRRTDGSLARLERVVRREKVGEITAVPVATMLDRQTGYVRITTFMGEKVADDLHDALGRLEKRGMRRLVLDLRNNGGGSVDEAHRIAGEFLPKGSIVYTSEGRKREVTDTGRVQRSFWSREKRYPMIVLQNEGSASASELVAGALQDHDRALIVGQPSFGKSLVMFTMPLSDGSAVTMVVGHIKTPCGRVIQRQYRNISDRTYRRLAGELADTAGRPSCKTNGGRTVYGGGGIVPDVFLAKPKPVELWLSRLYEEDIPLKWVGAYLDAHPSALTTVDALVSARVPPEG
ncbi:MAG TPA: S41 family peptidase, partial [Gemmatimonadaceae bacterium]|nr:S41 family peptidase [Gemmatimonadaceae bacterium]